MVTSMHCRAASAMRYWLLAPAVIADGLGSESIKGAVSGGVKTITSRTAASAAQATPHLWKPDGYGCGWDYQVVSQR